MEDKYLAISIIWISIGFATGWSKDYAVMFWGGIFASITSYYMMIIL